MKTENYSAAVLRKRKMLLVLPLLVLPFITLAFWAMGGGMGQAGTIPDDKAIHGLNAELPDARFKDDKAMNKIGYYDKAAHDSAKREELVRNDPYYKIKNLSVTGSSSADSTEAKVYQRIAELDKALNQKNSIVNESMYNRRNQPRPEGGEAEVLKNMMEDMTQSKSGGDPDVDKLNGMLDKIMDIQHPERLSGAVRKSSDGQKDRVFSIASEVPRNNISLLVDERSSRSDLIPASNDGFYSIKDPGDEVINPNAIEAVVHETRTVVNGSILKFRLSSSIYLNGILIPKGDFIYGKAALNGERLNIEIHSVRYKNSVYPVSLVVYDLDGMNGIFIPGAITRDVAKESSDRVIQGIALNSLDPSIGAQAASAGIEAAKNLLTKKVKLVKVLVKAGYKVLLKEKEN